MKNLKECRELREKVKDGVAFMGLSLGKPLFSNKKVMRNYIEFLHKNFSKSYLLIADVPKRYNIMALEGVSENRALERISRSSYNMRVFLEKLSKDYSDVDVINWNEADDESYRINLDILVNKYSENTGFRKECDDAVRRFLLVDSNKRKLEKIGSSLEQALSVASMYFLEELAMLLSFPASFEGVVCEVYPGINKVQDKLQNNEYDFCSELVKNPSRIFMEVYYE